MTRTLSARQLVDILFQKPGRITAGILEKRTLGARLKDTFLVRTTADGYPHAQIGPVEKLKRRMLLEFNCSSPVSEPHPRSLKRALLELRALGFSNVQLRQIDYHTSVAVSNFGHTNRDERRILLGERVENSDAFLGCATSKLTGKIYSGGLEGLEQSIRDLEDPQNVNNTCIREEDEHLLYDYYLQDFGRLAESNAQIFSPEGPASIREP